MGKALELSEKKVSQLYYWHRTVRFRLRSIDAESNFKECRFQLTEYTHPSCAIITDSVMILCSAFAVLITQRGLFTMPVEILNNCIEASCDEVANNISEPKWSNENVISKFTEY